jgi:hypothetical protein
MLSFAVEEENDELHEDLVRMMQERNATIARVTAARVDTEKWVSIAVDLATNLTWAMNIDTADYERQAACLAAYDEALALRERPQ